MILPPLASYTWGLLFGRSLNNCSFPKLDSVVSFWNSHMLFSGQS